MKSAQKEIIVDIGVEGAPQANKARGNLLDLHEMQQQQKVTKQSNK